jgi:hypothetical protein
MSVIAFTPKSLQQDGSWQASELDTIRRTFTPELANGEASGWHAASTEAGDPQFYLLGPLPDQECVLSVSRLGRVYVLEDGAGCVLFEHVKLDLLVQHAKTFLSRKKASLVARISVLWAAGHRAFQEKVEPLMAEGEELLFHMAPQLAALA